MAIDPAKVLQAAKMMIRQGIAHVAFEKPNHATLEELMFARAVVDKVQQLEQEGYQPPVLKKPVYQPDGSLLLGTDNLELEHRARTAFTSNTIESWEICDGEVDQKVLGRVTAIEPTEYVFLFTVTPAEDG